jgi:hypothetical protein
MNTPSTALETLRAEIESLTREFETRCQLLLESTGAEVVVVCLINSLIGTRCRVLGDDELKKKMPEILRSLSYDIEEKMNAS